MVLVFLFLYYHRSFCSLQTGSELWLVHFASPSRLYSLCTLFKLYPCVSEKGCGYRVLGSLFATVTVLRTFTQICWLLMFLISSVGFWWWYITLRISWFLDCVLCLIFATEHNVLQTESVSAHRWKGREASVQFGPLGRADLWETSSIQNIMFNTKYQMMNKPRIPIALNHCLLFDRCSFSWKLFAGYFE